MNKYHCGYLAAVLLGGMSTGYAQTFSVDIGKTEITGNLSTTVTAGTGIRTKDPTASLIGTSFGNNGKPKGGTGAETNDDGDMNFRRGDVFASPTKIFTRLNLTDGRYSIVLSTRAWVDATLETATVSQGNIPGENAHNQTLSDFRFTNMNKFANVAPWEAYGSARWSLGNDNPLSIRVGRQTMNWSVAHFFIDASHLNPVDLSALEEPGSLPDREVNIPTGFLDAKYKMNSGVEIEGFYQLEQRPFNLPGCGTFYSEKNIGTDPGCNAVIFTEFIGVNALYLPASYAVWDNSAYAVSHGDYDPRLSDRYYSEHKQGGLTVRYHVKALNLDTSIYLLNLESRIPIVDAAKSNNPSAWLSPDPELLSLGAPTKVAALATVAKSIPYFFQYPGDIHTIGVNATTKLHGWHLATEMEYTPNQAVQVSPVDVILSYYGLTTPFTPRVASKAAGSVTNDFDRLHNVRADVNVMRVIPNVLKAKQVVVFAELRDSGLPGIPSMSQTRYGRGFQWGFSSEGFGGMSACGAVTSPLSQPLAGCFNKGFITANAFAYRTRVALNYDLGHNLTVSPLVTWSHDVKGYSWDGQIVQGRGVVTPAVEWKWKKKYFGGISYTAEATVSTYNQAEDRDNAKAYVGINF